MYWYQHHTLTAVELCHQACVCSVCVCVCVCVHTDWEHQLSHTASWDSGRDLWHPHLSGARTGGISLDLHPAVFHHV